MKNYFLIPVLVLSFLSIILLGGCSKDTPTEPNTEEIPQLDKPYGGYTTSDELPAFGDPSMSTEFQDDENPYDPVATDPDFVAALDSNGVNAYFIHITWGMLEFDSTATEVLDWSGTASVNKGVLGIMRTIRFERNDRVILPRPNPQVLEWESHTMVHLDGISLVILDTDSTETPGEFTFDTGLYSRTFTFSELDSMELVESVTGSGHEISIISHSRQVIPLGGGFFDGRWVRKNEIGGEFMGRWMNRLGTHAGHLRGIWGVNGQGTQVFHGKYISLNGQFGGLLSGLWGFREGSETEGWMAGRWVNRSLTQIGTIRGHWKTREGNERHGFFHGQWMRSQQQ